MKKTANIELRDCENNTVKILKRNISLLSAYEYIRKHGDFKWYKNVPYSIVIA